MRKCTMQINAPLVDRSIASPLRCRVARHVGAYRLRQPRGFTLVELMVATLAGLVVAGAVVAVSKTATTTFQEESRVTSAEMAVRIASERLRADLSRASYMSSPNVRTDANLARPKGVAAPNVDTLGQFPNGMASLTGVRYSKGGSAAADPIVGALSLVNGLNPDSIVLGGNMTTTDEYVVQSILESGGEGCGGRTVRLSVDSPAIRRITHNLDGSPKSAAEATQALRDAFAPTDAAYMVRIVDESGKSQILPMCAAIYPTADASGVVAIPLDTNAAPLLTSGDTGARGGLTGFGVGRSTLNPVQLVRWSLRRRVSAVLDPENNPSTPSDESATRFELVRTWLDAKGVVSGEPEIVADYIVDMSFAFTVLNPATPGLREEFPFGAEDNKAWGQQTTAAMTPATNTRPDRVRSVRFRLAARAAIPDRQFALAGPTPGYIYRYCTNTAGCAGALQDWARVRTITGEVSLQNQWSVR
jgi:prepilin-type N-terminal cleavage/methylation domain-containing protein